MNPIDEDLDVDFGLYDINGTLLATARAGGEDALKARGHQALFLNEIEWTPEEDVLLDLSTFKGLLKVNASGRIAGTVLQTRPGVFGTQPVVPSLNWKV